MEKIINCLMLDAPDGRGGVDSFVHSCYSSEEAAYKAYKYYTENPITEGDEYWVREVKLDPEVK